MQKKEPYHDLKKWEKIISIEFTVLIICGMLLLLLLLLEQEIDMQINDLVIGILGSAISGAISSVFISIFIYYKYLKKIPDENKAKIEQLLNDRLKYESSNHNAVIQALSPSNTFLSTEHKEIQQTLRNIDGMSSGVLKDTERLVTDIRRLRERAIREDAVKDSMKPEQIHMYNLSLQMQLQVEKNITLEIEILRLKTELSVVIEKNKDLNAKMENSRSQVTRPTALKRRKEYEPEL